MIDVHAEIGAFESLNGGSSETRAEVAERMWRCATTKFGEVLATRKHSNSGTVFMIERREPANESLPFMTIRGFANASGYISFEHGHYDLNASDAQRSFEAR